MKINRYLLSLLLVPVLLFTAKSYAKNISEDNVSNELGNPAQPFVLEDIKPDGSKMEISGISRQKSLSDIVEDMDVVLYPEDKLSVFPDLNMGLGGKITLTRAPKIIVTDGKKKIIYRSWTKNIEELFAEKKIELGADDTVSPVKSSALYDNMSIKINRVAITTVVESKNIEFRKLEKEDPNLKYGKTRVESGVNGEKKLTYLVTRVDGEEVSRVLQKSEVVSPAKDEIKYIGTKVIVLSSVSGKATIGPNFCNIVSANYSKGTLVRITNSATRASFIDTVDCTWGTASAPSGVVLDLSRANLSRLKWNGQGAGPSVVVEEIER